jgi:hypothetical protein
MKRTFLSFAVILACLKLMAQQDYYIFIQEPSGQPFYIRIGEQSHSSSAGGHIILSPVKDSVYNMFIGFPRSRYPEQLFTVAVNKKDRGFELKNMGGGWQLFDLQSLQLLKPVIAQEKNELSTKKTDSYSELMAGVVDDSAVLYSSVAKVDSVKKEPEAEITEKKPEPAIKENIAKKGAGKKGAKKKAEEKKKEELIKEDVVNNDTVNIVAGKNVEEKKQEPVIKEDIVKNDVVKKEPEKKEEEKKQEPVIKEDIVKNDVVKKEPEKKEELIKADGGAKKIENIKKDTNANAKVPEPAPVKPVTEETREPSPEKAVASQAPAASHRDKRDIIRFSTENVPEGKLIIYLDRTGPVTDTIRIIIPRL